MSAIAKAEMGQNQERELNPGLQVDRRNSTTQAILAASQGVHQQDDGIGSRVST